MLRVLTAAAAALLVTTSTAGAQASSGDHDDWKVGIYPVYVWLPIGTDIDVTVDPGPGDGGGRGSILDSQVDGAFMGGFYASKGRFRIEADGLWASFGGDRPDSPFLDVDVDAIYFHTTAGVRLGGDFYAVGGVRRLAAKYEIQLGDLPFVEGKPGLWDPIVGVAWHREGHRVFDFHASFEFGGFGVGTDREIAATARLDVKPFRHFGFTAGYSMLNFKFERELGNRDVTIEQTLQGPIMGIGFYF